MIRSSSGASLQAGTGCIYLISISRSRRMRKALYYPLERLLLLQRATGQRGQATVDVDLPLVGGGDGDGRRLGGKVETSIYRSGGMQ